MFDGLLAEFQCGIDSIKTGMQNAFLLGEQVVVDQQYKKKIKKLRDECVEKGAEVLDSDVVSPKLHDEIVNYDSGVDMARDLSKAKKTDRLIYYTLYYMTYKCAKLIEFESDKDKAFINGVCKLAGFPLIYPSVTPIDLTKYDPHNDNYTPDGSYIVDIDDLKNKFDLSDVKEKMTERKNELDAGGAGKAVKETAGWSIHNIINDDDIIQDPLNVNINSKGIAEPIEYYAQGHGIDDATFGRLEEIISEFDVPKAHRWEKSKDGLYQLLIKHSNGSESTNIIDLDGITYGGNRSYLMARVQPTPINDSNWISIPMDYYNKQLIQNIINNPFYVPGYEEIQQVVDYYLPTDGIYKYLDMQNTPWLNNLNELERIVLHSKIMYVVDYIENSGGWMPRVRFVDFKSVDEFTLGSDSKVKFPLFGNVDTTSMICEDFKIQIAGNTVTQSLRGQVYSWVIPDGTY